MQFLKSSFFQSIYLINACASVLSYYIQVKIQVLQKIINQTWAENGLLFSECEIFSVFVILT